MNNRRRHISVPEHSCTNCASLQEQLGKVIHNFDAFKKQHSQPETYVFQTPLPQLISFIHPCAAHEVLKTLDHHVYIKDQCEMFNNRLSVEQILKKLDRIRDSEKNIIRFVFEYYFEKNETKNGPAKYLFLLELFSNSMISIQKGHETVFDPKYWECVHYIMRFVCEMDNFEAYINRFNPKHLAAGIVDDIRRTYKHVRDWTSYEEQWSFAIKNIINPFEEDHDPSQGTEFKEEEEYDPSQDNEWNHWNEEEEDYDPSQDNQDIITDLNAKDTDPPPDDYQLCHFHGVNEIPDTEDEKYNLEIQLNDARHCWIDPTVSAQINKQCVEHCSDDKTMYDYLRGRWNMAVNDVQHDIIKRNDESLCFIHLGLHHVQTKELMYGVVTETDEKYKSTKYKCKLTGLMTAVEIRNMYQVSADKLPQSSQIMKWYKVGLKHKPTNSNVPVEILKHVTWKQTKYTVDNDSKGKYKAPKSSQRISKQNFEYLLCEDQNSWSSNLEQDVMIPIIAILGSTSRVEWIRILRVALNDYVGVSFVYHIKNKKWAIGCLHFDPVRVYYQHRLVGLDSNDMYYYSLDEIKNHITKSVVIV